MHDTKQIDFANKLFKYTFLFINFFAEHFLSRLIIICQRLKSLTSHFHLPKVSPIIINTVITIQSALSPASETPEELESPVQHDLWERRNLRDLKLWFLEEEGEEDTQSVVPLIPQGESLKMSIQSICVTLEAGVGHRTVPMLLAKSSFHGDVKNWTTLINLHCHLDLEVRSLYETLFTLFSL